MQPEDELKAELSPPPMRCSRWRSRRPQPGGRAPRPLAGSIGSACIWWSARTWNDRRLVIFTEYEDTRRYLERRLKEGLRRRRPRRGADRHLHRCDQPRPPARTSRRAFNCRSRGRAHPNFDLHRTLPAKGINLQTRAVTYLIHFDSALEILRGVEQRNGPQSIASCNRRRPCFCRYFVLRPIAPRTSCWMRWCGRPRSSAESLGRPGRVIEDRIAKRLEREGITDARGGWRRRSRTRTTPERIGNAPASRWDDGERSTTPASATREHEDLQRSAWEES